VVSTTGDLSPLDITENVETTATAGGETISVKRYAPNSWRATSRGGERCAGR
jgi:hypothetical protein